MAPVIRLEYDDAKLSDSEIEKLSKAVRDIVAAATGIEEVFVYANTAKIKVQIAPIEIWVEMSAQKIENEDALIATIKQKIIDWKKENDFSQPINLTLIPMKWKLAIGI